MEILNMEKDTLYVFPPSLKSNQYLHINIDILKKGYNVQPLSLYSFGAYCLKFGKTKQSFATLNWFEDNGSKSFWHFVFYVFSLFLIKLLFGKIIWVRHNFKPHSGNLKYYKILTYILNLFSDKKVTHRELFGYELLAHPLYPVDICVNDYKRDVEYLCFGKISQYKGIVELLTLWDKSKKLSIVGKCEDKDLESQIHSTILKYRLDVDFVNKFIPDDELNLLLTRTKYVVLPHLKQTMIVSGSFYHSISYGANIVFSDQNSYDFAKKYVDCVCLLGDLESHEAILPYDVVGQAKNSFGNEVVYNGWTSIINSLKN
jgi:beta-1,4-mannosyltransferase